MLGIARQPFVQEVDRLARDAVVAVPDQLGEEQAAADDVGVQIVRVARDRAAQALARIAETLPRHLGLRDLDVIARFVVVARTDLLEEIERALPSLERAGVPIGDGKEEAHRIRIARRLQILEQPADQRMILRVLAAGRTRREIEGGADHE